MDTGNQFLGTERIGTLMRKYAVPCIISLLVGALYNIVDQIFIANASYLGSYGNAANTVVFPLTVVAMALAVMVGDGCCAFVSMALGRNELGNEDVLWEHQFKVITALAEKGPCVIVGRCADYILRDKADCLKVFIHADLKFRAERIVKVYGEREQSPEERLWDKDKRRAAYHRFYTNMKWGRAQNYHLTLDSGVVGIDRCVEIIAGLY